MIEFASDYLFYLLKIVTVVIAFVYIFSVLSSAKLKKQEKGHLTVKNLSKSFKSMGAQINRSHLPPKDFKKLIKEEKKLDKKISKSKNKEAVFVLDFSGDIQATGDVKLKEEINAILSSDLKCKEVVLKLESRGGSAYAYGLCAAELKRLVDHNINLTVCIDKVAASGGYLMSCVATKIIAAPWAIVGSIGVIAQLPNFHRLLKKNDIDIELHTAGEFKRTLTSLGKNTAEGRKKFISELQELHTVFKDFVSENRSQINTKKVATGEVWQGNKALELGLIDEIGTSNDYLIQLSSKYNLYEIDFVINETIGDKFSFASQMVIERSINKFYDLINRDRFIS